MRGEKMNRIKLKLIISAFIVLTLFILAGNGWTSVSLPNATFAGVVQTTPGIDTGTLDFSTVIITSVFYLDSEGVPTQVNTPGVETIIGKLMTLSAVRTGDYTFGDATLSIGDASNTYFTATLNNIEFVQIGSEWALNPNLDSSDPSTLNISAMSFPTNRTTHPSRFIDELEQRVNDASNTGIKMRLSFVYPDPNAITGFGIATISEGVLDGAPALPDNSAPIANAGDNITIVSEEIDSTTILGTAEDADIDDILQCRWIVGDTELDWMSPVGVNDNECPLDLSTLSFGTLYIGDNTLTLEVDDGQAVSSDDMILTIDNSAPNAGGGGAAVCEVNTEIELTVEVSDFDGDQLYYEWLEGTDVLCSGGPLDTIAGGTPVLLPPCPISYAVVGTHDVYLQVNDGTNGPVSSGIMTLNITDDTAPTLAPDTNRDILWPPDHKMVDIVIQANAYDNSGLPVTLSVDPVDPVLSNEPEYGLGDGDTGPDWTLDGIDDSTGTIYLQLRRERSGSGDGRIYSVNITATDISGNMSTAEVNIIVPHDMRGKK
jgi:hypothetical protein